MIYFLYGEDTYRSRRKLEEIIEHYRKVHKSGLNLRFFDCKSTDYSDFKDGFGQIPMFEEKKLLVLKNVFKNQAFRTVLLEDAEKFLISKDIIVIHEEGAVPTKDALLSFLTQKAKFQEFGALGPAKLRGWIEKEFKDRGGAIRPEAVFLLANYVGNDLWRLSNEIQKLASFSRESMVGSGDISLLVRPATETDIFKTVEALARRNKKTALFLLHEHLVKGDSPLYLLSMFSFQFRNLLLVKKTGRLKGHPYFVRKTASLAASFSFEDLSRIYRKIFETDLKIKTGRIDPQFALDLLIAEI